MDRGLNSYAYADARRDADQANAEFERNRDAYRLRLLEFKVAMLEGKIDGREKDLRELNEMADALQRDAEAFVVLVEEAVLLSYPRGVQ